MQEKIKRNHQVLLEIINTDRSARDIGRDFGISYERVKQVSYRALGRIDKKLYRELFGKNFWFSIPELRKNRDRIKELIKCQQTLIDE